MPFKSEDQRRYLWAKHPDITRRWSKKYGSNIQKVARKRLRERQKK